VDKYFFPMAWRLTAAVLGLGYGHLRPGAAKSLFTMSIIRHLAGVCVAATLISGCANNGIPDVASSFSHDTLNSPWPGFLPVDEILSGNLVDFEASRIEVQNLQARLQRLRRRARLLRGPVLKIQERLQMQAAVSTSNP
jgi:hypothetical protein